MPASTRQPLAAPVPPELVNMPDDRPAWVVWADPPAGAGPAAQPIPTPPPDNDRTVGQPDLDRWATDGGRPADE